MKKRLLFSIILLIACFILPSSGIDKDRKEITLAMCRPAEGQIRNIVEMYEKDILPLTRLKLICVFHENEEDDYTPSFEYVKENNLYWISFRAVTGRVNIEDIYKENQWTPQFREIFESADGILFTGGMDIPPVLYGEKQSLLTEATTPTRSYYEISFLFHLIGGGRNPAFKPFLSEKPAYPILAICLGAQSLNVAAGGTLIQDIPSEVYGLHTVEQVLSQDPERIHSSVYQKKLAESIEDISPAFHHIILKKKSLFCGAMGVSEKERPLILTSHHQAIDRLGLGLHVTATSLDGKIVEAVEHDRFPQVLGIQFHPEPYSLFSKTLHYRPTRKDEKTRNLREYLQRDGISWPFHMKIWRWFASVLEGKK